MKELFIFFNSGMYHVRKVCLLWFKSQELTVTTKTATEYEQEQVHTNAASVFKSLENTSKAVKH